jgi:hypothetical protein
MDEERTTYLYERFTISTFRAEGLWWAGARSAEKDAGGDRPVLGGPWRSQPEARAAAQAFCDQGRAGNPGPYAGDT